MPGDWDREVGRLEGKFSIVYSTGGKHKARGPNPALHLVLSGPTPCFYPVAAPSSRLTVKEQLHVYTVLNYIQPFEGNRGADVAPGENEFDTPGLPGDWENGRQPACEDQVICTQVVMNQKGESHLT